MALYTGPEKRLMKVGAKKATTWDTAVAVGAGNGLPTKSLAGFERKQDYCAAEEADSPMVRTSQLDVVKPVDFTHGVEMLYDPGALGAMIALFMGVAGVPTIQGAGPAYLHTLQLADQIQGKFATVVRTMPGKIWECPSAKPMEWTVKTADRGMMGSELKFRGNNVKDDSAVNLEAQITALTYADRENRVMFRHNAVKMNDASAGSVDSETALNVNGIEVSIKRSGYDEPRGANGTQILEPAEAGRPDIRVKINFPRFDATNAAFIAKAVAETYQKMTITFTGALLNATYYYTLKFWLPKLRMLNPDAPWEDIVKMGLELVAEEATAAPTGMLYTRPYVTLINKQTTDYLA
jgi:hypothetical protein